MSFQNLLLKLGAAALEDFGEGFIRRLVDSLRREHMVDEARAEESLAATLLVLEGLSVADEAGVESRLRDLAEERGWKAGHLFMPIRVAVTGRTESPGLFETLRVIGDERVRDRILKAIWALDKFS